MGKRKSQMGNTIMYGEHMYDLDGVEYCELEDRLNILDQLAEQDRTLGFEWVIYKFLTEKDYHLTPPSKPEPKPRASLNEIRDFYVTNGRKPSDVAKDDLRARLKTKLPWDDDSDAVRPVRIPKPTPNSDPFAFPAHLAPKKHHELLTTEARAADAGGSVGIILILILAIAAASSWTSNLPYAEGNRLVRPDGTVVEQKPWEGNMPALSSPAGRPSKTAEEITGKTTVRPTSPDSGLVKKESKNPSNEPSKPSVPAPTVVPDLEVEKRRKVFSPATEEEILPKPKVLPKEMLEELRKTRPTEND